MQRFLLCAFFLLTLGAYHAHDISHDGDNLALERKELLKVAYALEKALNELRRLEKAKAIQSGWMDAQLRKPPTGGAMDQIVTIQDWEGPLESLLKTIAEKYHYKLNIMGRKPTLPILVSISTQNKTLGTVIQDADLQAGRRANISVDHTTERTIELCYVSQA